MSPPFAQTAVLAGLLVVATATGTLVGRALGLRRWSRRTPDAVAVAAGLGAMVWTLGFGLLSGPARLPARSALVVLLAAVAGLAAVVVWRHRARRAPVRRPARGAGLALAGACALAAVLGLLPVWTAQGFSPGNDTYTYCALAEWLQHHGFGEAASKAVDRPVDSIAAQQQQRGFPLGGTYPLALARATGVAPTSLALYPAVSTLGLVLAVGALWAATRLVVHAPVSVTAAIVLAFAAAPHAGFWAHHNGFLSQTYAVPGLLLGLTAVSAGRGLHDRSGLVLWAVAFAFLCVVYLPFVPLLAVGTLAHAARGLAAPARRGRGALLPRLGLAALLVALLIGLDVTSPLRGLFDLLASRVGAHVPLSPLGMASIALGPGPGPAVGVPRALAAGAGWLTGVAALLAGLGVASRWREPRLRGTFAALAVLAALAAWNAVVARDPWTGAPGHTWNLFKTAQWAFPLLLLVEAAGLTWASRRAPRIEAVFLAGALALAPAHLPWATDLGRGFAGLIDIERPLAELDGLVRRFHALPPGRILLLGQPAAASPFRGAYAALLAWPRGVIGDWEGSASVPLPAGSRALWRGLLARIGTPGVVPVLIDAPPFDRAEREDLGGGFAHLTSVGRPRLVQVVAPGPRSSRVGPREPVVAPVGRRTKLLLLAPRHEPVDVVIEIERPPGLGSDPILCQVVPHPPDRGTFRQARRAAVAEELDFSAAGSAVVRVDARWPLTTLLLTPERRPVRLLSVGLRPGAP